MLEKIDISKIFLIVQKEVKDSLSNKWFILYTLLLTILAVLFVYLGYSSGSIIGYKGYSKTAASLINLILLFIPLIALVTGSISISGERENKTLPYLLSHPINKIEIFLGKYLGILISIMFVIFLSFGVAGILIYTKGTGESSVNYFITTLLSVLLAASLLSMGFLISIFNSRVSKSISIAILIWFIFLIIGDLGIIGMSTAIKLGVKETFYLTIVNPLEAYKIASILTLTPRFEILGPAGVYALNTFGKPLLLSLLIFIQLLWALIPIGISIFYFCYFRKEEV